MIENERQLRHSIETITKLYAQREREQSETAWNEQTRQEMADDTKAVRESIECEVARYLARKYGFANERQTLESVK